MAFFLEIIEKRGVFIMENKPQQGTKISGKKASAERYVPFYEFLLFDPLYRQMSDRAKTLYTFLRSKIKDFEFKQGQFENGESTRSYADDEGNIFILADNTEISYIMNASEPTVIKAKEELKIYGLLLENHVPNKANQIYVLEPAALADRWAWIEEVKELRAKKEAKNKEKKAKEKAKKDQEKRDLKKLSPADLKNLSPRDLKNLSKTKSKLRSKLTLNSSKHTLNLSIIDSEKIREYLPKYQDRLTDSKLVDIQELHEIYKDLDDMIFISKVSAALENSKSNFRNYLNNSLLNHLKEAAAAIDHKVIREENIPDWMKKQKEEAAAAAEAVKEAQEAAEPTAEELAAKQKEFEKTLADYEEWKAASKK